MKVSNVICIHIVLSILIGCDTFAVRKIGSCVTSKEHGGPYKIVESVSDQLEVVDMKGVRKFFPNDYSWISVTCQ